MIFEDSMVDRLLCVACRSPLRRSGETKLQCSAPGCAVFVPVHEGIPDMLPGGGDGSDVETDYHESPSRGPWSVRELHIEQFFRRLRHLVDSHAQSLGRGVDFLDIGSGALLRGIGGRGGRFFRIIRDFGRSYTGIEPSWRMLKAVDVPDGNINYVPAPLLVRSAGELLPVRPASFDIVLNLSVLDHCMDAGAVVSRSREALRPNGLAVVHLQNENAWYREVVRTVAPRYFRRRAALDNHHHRFTPAETGSLLRERGFATPKWEETGYLNAPGLVWLVTMALYPVRLVGAAQGASLCGRIDRLASRLLPGKGMTFLIHARAGAGTPGLAGSVGSAVSAPCR